MTEIEIYGFVGWVLSVICYVGYITWALVPESYLIELGWTYYPSKYWALALPTWLVLTLFMLPFFYYGLSLMFASADIDALNSLTDDHAVYSSSPVAHFPYGTLPPLSDLSLSQVNS